MSTNGIAFTRKTRKPARGSLIGARKSSAVAFDPVVFDRISAMAHDNKISFQEQIRRLCALAMRVTELETAP